MNCNEINVFIRSDSLWNGSKGGAYLVPQVVVATMTVERVPGRVFSSCRDGVQ
jgi:hypothetical protein